jgi:4-amino-4-deoxy-L-arabinose transferase-like glycosyltransferase
MPRRALLLVGAVALFHATLFIVYQQPDWNVAWSDQGGYKQLGAGMAQSGSFTRFPNSPVFIPEVIRTPGYPAFVAAVYSVSGIGNDLAVAIAQAFVFAALCFVVFLIARRVTSERTALVAAAVVACFPPLPYYGALVLTEVWTTFVLALAMLACHRAMRSDRATAFVLAGLLFTAVTMVRPAFVLLPFGLAVGMPLLVPSERRTRRRLVNWAAFAVAAAIALVPWFTYNYVHLGRFTLSPAGGIGRGLWEGSWQGHWPGRLHDQLTETADTDLDTATLDSRIQAIAQGAGLPAEPMLNYVHEWRDIRAIWLAPTDPLERARARVVADDEYRRAALERIGNDFAGWSKRRLTYGLFVLWASDIPIRYTDINRTPWLVIRAIWFVQVVVLGLAIWGLVTLLRRGQFAEAALLALPLLYVTGVHLPLLCETRQSLPVKPLVLLLAAIAVTSRQTSSS